MKRWGQEDDGKHYWDSVEVYDAESVNELCILFCNLVYVCVILVFFLYILITFSICSCPINLF